MKSEINYLVILKNGAMTAFMQASDAFNAGKIIGKFRTVEISYKAKATIEIAEKLISHVKSALAQSGETAVFIHLDTIDGVKNDSVLPYYDKKVREISNGKQSFLLRDYIAKLGLNPICDDNCFVNEIKF